MKANPSQPIASTPKAQPATTAQSIDKIYQSKLPQAIQRESQSTGILGKLLTDRDWQKRAENIARSQAINEYMGQTKDYTSPIVKTNISDTISRANQMSQNAQNAIKNTKKAVNVMRYIPGAGIGELGANIIRQNMDTPFSKKMTLDDLISEQQDIPLSQVQAMSPDEKSKMGMLSQGMLGVGGALDLIPFGSAAKQVFRAGAKPLAQMTVKGLIKNMATKEGAKSIAKNAGIGGATSSLISGLSTKAMGGTNEQALQSAGQSFLPGVVGGLINSPYNAAESSVRNINVPRVTTKLVPNMLANEQTKAVVNAPGVVTRPTQTPQVPLARTGQNYYDIPGRKPSVINEDEKLIMSDFIDSARPKSSGYRPDPKTKLELEYQATRLAERYGIPLGKTKTQMANNFAKVLEEGYTPPKDYGTNVRQLTPEQVKAQQKRDNQGGFARIPGGDKTKVTVNPDPLEAIRIEARKYKTADEFIRSQGGDQLVSKPDAVQFDSKAIEAFRNQYFEKPNSKKVFNNREQTINGMKRLFEDAKKSNSKVTVKPRTTGIERQANKQGLQYAPPTVESITKQEKALNRFIELGYDKKITNKLAKKLEYDKAVLNGDIIDTPKITANDTEFNRIEAEVAKTIERLQQSTPTPQVAKTATKRVYSPDDPNYWATPIKGEPKSKMPNVKDTNGIQPKEGDVIEFPGVLGNKGKSTVKWQEPSIANASGERVEGKWIGNGELRADSPIPFTIVERNGKPITKTEAPAITPKKVEAELPIVGKPIASQKIVEPSIASSTKAKQEVVSPKSQSKLSKKAQTYDPIIAEKDKASVIANLDTKHQEFEKSLYGDTTDEIIGGTKGASKYQQAIRGGKESYNTAIQKGLSSENSAIRNISRGIRTLFGSAGDTAERITKKGAFRGGIDESINMANDFNDLGKKMLPNKASQERVWAVLDPELATTKISESELKPKELKALQTLKQASDLINDQNFAMGKISHETWLKGKGGKYLTRAYEEYDIPTELKDMFTQPGKGKLDTGAYKARKDVDQWKQENAIKDPFYLASKRIQSTFRNKAITDYATWINKNADMVSDTPKAGYTQLSESPMWGELSGKNVRKDVLTDIKGFYSDSKALQGAYDMLNAYDKFKPRQVLKMTKTILNPATRLGNQVSNRVFATLSGTNVARFEYNMHKFAPQELANNGKYARLLRKEGILGTDSTKYDLAQSLIKDGADPSKIKQVMDKIKSSYGAADDKAKLSAFKSWIDSGKTVDEALTKVRNGFQDYSKVGLLYDIGAKMPLIGKPFIRFQSELARIVKNSITENPLRAAGTVGAIALIGEMSSRMSGETPEDKATREARFGTPVIPFTQIPLVFQTPIGEVNVARMFGMYETAGADTKNKNLVQRASKYLPFDVPTNKDELVKSLGNDVLFGGIANQVTDTDFRGKSISDPESNKYQESTLTDAEKAVNRAAAFYHNYQLPFVNDVENLGRAVTGTKDIYGREKTPLQAASKLTGFKVEQFGPEQAAEQRAKDAVYSDYDRKDLQSQINSVMKSQAKGEINESTANARIKELQKKAGATQTGTESVKGIFKNPSGGFSYIDSNGDLRTAKTEDKAKQAVAKIEFELSDQDYLEKDGYVYTRKDDGTAESTPVEKFNSQMRKAQLESYKDTDDIDNWLTTAETEAKSIIKQLDKATNPKEKATLENDLRDMITQIKKYQSYGGFTKPKSSGSSSKGISFGDIYGETNNSLSSLRNLVQGTKTIKRKAIR